VTPAAESETTAIVALLAAATPEAGRKVFKKCGTCHSPDKDGKRKIGPNLWDVVDRPIASAEGFTFSGALAAKSGEAWSYENLDAFLERPRDWAPGTRMGFAGLKKPEQRAAVIAYLRSLSDNPAALPK
jgi:cytochrome c